MATLDVERVEEALRRLISDIDYDTHKSLDSDEETGEDHYPDLADDFMEYYEATA
jgi:hypothetical protein